MALSRKSARYSSDLDGLAKAIRADLARSSSPQRKLRILGGIADFCFGYSKEFTTTFCSRIGIGDDLPPHTRFEVGGQAASFAEYLLTRPEQCVFLLRDPYSVYERVASRRADSIGALLNRDFICGPETNYFAILGLVYDSLEFAESFEEFRANYRMRWREVVRTNERLRTSADAIGEYLGRRSSRAPMLFVDCGLQFSLSLFCAAAVEAYSGGVILTDVMCFSTMPWLQRIFAGRYFTERSELVLSLEEEGRRDFARSLRDRGAGALVGFAAGDALGFPVAGVSRAEVARAFPRGITRFEAGPGHPFFSELEPGQYTSNTIMMLLTARWALQEDLEPSELAHAMLTWWRDARLRHPQDIRWLGPTTEMALAKLDDGVRWDNAGSATTQSCAGLYRTIPVAICLRPLAHGGQSNSADALNAVSSITHRSKEALRGAQIYGSVIGDVIHGIRPRIALEAAVSMFEEPESRDSALLRKVADVIALSEEGSDEKARLHLGTGSPIAQTLPLSLYFALRYSDGFEAGVLGAANSFRNDDADEFQRLQGLDREAQMKEARGGNTDGTAALVGAILGAYLGANSIPSGLTGVEDSEALSAIGAALALKADTF